MLVIVGNADGLRTRKNWLDLVSSIAHAAEDFLLGCDGFGGGELPPGNALLPLNDLKFPGSQAGVKMGADLGMSDLAHTSAQSVPDQGTFIHNRFAFEVLIAGEGERFSHSLKRIDWLLVKLGPFPRCTDYSLGLVSKIGRQLPMRGHHFSRRMDLFTVAGRVGGDFGGLFSCAARASEVFTNLLAARTGCVEILLRVSLDLWGAASSSRNLITELAQFVGQLGLIDGRGELLRGEEAVRLNGAGLAVVALRDIENDSGSVQLWRDLAIDRAGCIVLKLGGDK